MNRPRSETEQVITPMLISSGIAPVNSHCTPAAWATRAKFCHKRKTTTTTKKRVAHKKQKFVFQHSGVGKSTAIWYGPMFWFTAQVLVHRQCLLAVFSHGKRGQGISLIFFVRALSSLSNHLPKAPLLIPSLCR